MQYNKKTLFPVIFFLFLFQNLRAQNADYQWHFLYEGAIKEWHAVPDGSGWIGVGHTDTYFVYPYSVPFAIRIDDGGQLIWRNIYPDLFQEIIEDIDILPLSNGTYFIADVGDACDYLRPESWGIIDSTGSLSQFHETDVYGTYPTKIFLLELPNGNVMLQTNQFQIEIKPDGQELYTWEEEFNWNNIVPRYNGGYLALGDYKVASTNWLQSLIPIDFPDKLKDGFQLASGEWIFLGEQSLWKTTNTYQPMMELPLDFIENARDLEYAYGAFWIAAESSQEEALIVQVDTGLNVLQTYISSTDYRFQSIFAAMNETLFLSGESNLHKNENVFLKSESINNPVINSTADLALADLRIPQMPVYQVVPCDAYTPGITVLIDSLYATITNYGTTTVHSFRINGTFPSCMNVCYSEMQFSKVFSVAINPGESLEVVLATNLQLERLSDVSPLNLCFWVTVPDEKTDADAENNQLCKDFGTILPTQTLDVTLDVSLAPNPASETLTIQILGNLSDIFRGNIVLSNLQGQTLLVDRLEGNAREIDVSGLPNGLYFISIQNALGGVNTQKIFVSH